MFLCQQTSSGKTYNMIGDESMPGIIPSAIKHIFKAIGEDHRRDFLLKIGYIEIYNDKIYDLFDGNRKELNIFETHGKVVVTQKEFAVQSEEEVFAHFNDGNKLKRIVETTTNVRSSRSHTIFRITIESQSNDGSDDVKVANLFLVDLAGSEKPDQSKSTFAEGLHINKSLLVLGRIIRQLSKAGSKSANCRECKLTRILAPALGGNSLTAIICTVSPMVLEETYHTIGFAQNAKKAKTNPTFNTAPRVSLMVRQDAIRDSVERATSKRRKVSTPVHSDLDLSRPDTKFRKLERKSIFRASISKKVVQKVQYNNGRQSVLLERHEENHESIACVEAIEMKESLSDKIIQEKDELIKNLEISLTKARQKIFKNRKSFEIHFQGKHDAIDQMKSTHEKLLKEANNKVAALQKDIEIYEKSVFSTEIAMKVMESKLNKTRSEKSKVEMKFEEKFEEIHTRFEKILNDNEETILNLQEQVATSEIRQKERQDGELKFYIDLDKRYSDDLQQLNENFEIEKKTLIENYELQLKLNDDMFNYAVSSKNEEIAQLVLEMEKLKVPQSNTDHDVVSQQFAAIAKTLSAIIEELNDFILKSVQENVMDRLSKISTEVKTVITNLESLTSKKIISKELSESFFTPPPSSESGVDHSPRKVKSAPCTYCNKSYIRQSSLDRHIRMKHFAQEHRYECDECSDTFKTKSALNSHKRTFHRGEKSNKPLITSL